MQHRPTMKWLASACLAAGMFGAASAHAADAAAKDRYDAAQKSAEADFKANVARCEDLKDNAKKVCVENAKGNEKIAKANATADYKGTPGARYDAAVAKADSDYSVAKLKCNDQTGNGKDVCLKDATAAKTKAYGDAKVMRTSRESSKDTADARKEANADTRDAQYKAAKERCDAYSGATKDNCLNDAKAQFGQ